MYCEKEDSSRISKLITGEQLDRVPIIMNIGVYAAFISNISSFEYYTDVDKAYEAQLWAQKLHDDDGGMSYHVPSNDAENFGGHLEVDSKSRIAMPRVTKRIVESELDVEMLEVPNLKKCKYIINKLEFDRRLVAEGGGVSLSSGSPMSIAINIVGIEQFMRWMYKSPELLHRVLRVATDYLLELADIYIEEFGAENCTASSSYPSESHALISPKMFEKYSLPYIAEIHEKLIEKGITNWSIHLCGDHIKNLKYWINDIKLCPRSLITIGEEMNIEKVAEAFGKDHIIGGNINTSFLQLGSAREVYKECEKVINKMKYNKGGFILTPACSLPAKTPPVNVHAMLEAVNTFGRYD